MHWKQGGDPTGVYSKSHGPVGRPSEQGAAGIEHHCPARRQLGKGSSYRGVTKGAMAGIVPESWLEWGLGAEGDLASMTSEADTLAAHETVTTNSRKRPSKCRQAG